MAEDLGVLKPEERKSFAALAEVRNRFAHRVANINGNLEQFAKVLPPPDLSNLCKQAMMVPRELEEQVSFLWNDQKTPALLRYVLWTAGSMLLDALATQDAHAELEAARRTALEDAAKAHEAGKTFSLADLFKPAGPNS